MSLSRALAAFLIAIVSFVPVAVRAQQTFDVGKSAPAAPSFKKSFGSPPDPVVVARDLTCTLIAHAAPYIDPRFLPASDEDVPTVPIVTTADAWRAPPARSLA
jgi:hypothetical protein